jgi:pimeloyl-ACP methyl ester carboxylesterase
MPTIAIPQDPIDIWYDVNGSGFPLVTIGGDILASEQFIWVSQALSESFMHIEWDFRGVGKSTRVHENIGMTAKVSDLAAILDHLEVERTLLWATATGSYTAIKFAAEFPDRVAALVTYPQFRPTEGMWRIWRVLDKVFDEFPWDEASRYICKLFGSPAKIEEWLVERFVENIDAAGYRAMHPSQLAEDLTNELASLSCPILFLLGDTGPMGAGSAYAAGLQRAMELQPGAEIAFVAGATGTYCMLEAPESTLEVVVPFLQRSLTQTT